MSKRRQERIDYIRRTISPFKGWFVRENEKAILVSFESLTYAARYAHFVADKCSAEVVVWEGSATIQFNCPVDVLLSIE